MKLRVFIYTVRDSLSWLFVLVTVIGSLIAFMPEEEAEWLRQAVYFSWYNVWPLLLVLFAISVAALLSNWPKTRAVYRDSKTDIRIILERGDLLKQEGLKVIHTVDTFDTELGRIIGPQTLHGAFLQLCAEKNINVDEQIDHTLEKYKPVRSNKNLPGRKDQYALGTICPVDIQGQPFCCVAFTHLQPDGTIEISKEEYIKTLKRMWLHLANPLVKQDEVNVAVIGNRFVDLPAEFSTEQKIDIMIQTFFAVAREKSCCRTLRICVHPTNAVDVDFDRYPVIIEHLAKRPVI